MSLIICLLYSVQLSVVIQYLDQLLAFLNNQTDSISMIISSECREELISAVSSSEEVEDQSTHKAEQKIFALYYSTVFNFLMLINLLIILDKNQSLALTALIVKIDDKEIWKLSIAHTFISEQKHMTDQKIHSCLKILL